MNTYWVNYKYSFDYEDDLLFVKEHEEHGDAGRFQCLKKNIKKEVKKYIIENDLCYGNYSNLKIIIEDFYITTDCEQ